MQGQPPAVWDHARDCSVYDAYGNMWLDFSSGVLVTNAGHSHPLVVEALRDQIERGLLHNYCFPSEIRGRLAKRLVDLAPDPLGKAFILTTGSEATECAIKLVRTHGLRQAGPEKIVIVTFENAFHGRTLGAQLAGGIPSGKDWIVKTDAGFVQVPFPDGYRCEDTSFDLFVRSLEELGVSPARVAGVMSETYQGGGASFMPSDYARKLRQWCVDNGALLVFDEVQAGFGRTGVMFGFEHYGVVPDLACFGKGISSSLPVSAVVGRADIMDQYEPRQMTSTHSGSPLCMAASLASIDVIEREGLVENARKMGALLHGKLNALQKALPRRIGSVQGKGLVAGVHCTRDGSKEPDPDLAFDVVEKSFEKGVMMFAPVGFMGATVKIAPPLTIKADAVEEGCSVIEEAFRELLE